MNPDISPENEQYLEHTVATGMFHDRSQALNTAIVLLKRREQLIRDVNMGIEQLEQGLGKPLDIAAILDAIDTRLAEEGRQDE